MTSCNLLMCQHYLGSRFCQILHYNKCMYTLWLLYITVMLAGRTKFHIDIEIHWEHWWSDGNGNQMVKSSERPALNKFPLKSYFCRWSPQSLLVVLYCTKNHLHGISTGSLMQWIECLTGWWWFKFHWNQMFLIFWKKKPCSNISKYRNFNCLIWI